MPRQDAPARPALLLMAGWSLLSFRLRGHARRHCSVARRAPGQPRSARDAAGAVRVTPQQKEEQARRRWRWPAVLVSTTEVTSTGDRRPVADVRSRFAGETMCATDAKKMYTLRDSDLAGLECELQENPHGAHYAPMRLFLRTHLQAACLARHGSKEGLALKKQSIGEAAAKRKATMAANKQRVAAAPAAAAAASESVPADATPTSSD
jgi:hypothetical protein